jgi:D-lactate dehydrogenase
MKVAVFDTHDFERSTLTKANERFSHVLKFLEVKLTPDSALLAKDSDCVCAFTNDCLDMEVLTLLAGEGVKLIALRSAGFNHVNLAAAKKLGLKVVRVPEYSPYSVAEYAVGLILCLNRKIPRAYNRVREGNFSLEGLVGFDLHGKTVGVIGAGRIGKAFIRIMRGFGCRVLVYDPIVNQDFAKEVGCVFSTFQEVIAQADVLSLHIPLSTESTHLIDDEIFKALKPGCILINTGRGALLDTKALIRALKAGTLGGAGLDVYEEEANFFFEDHSGEVLQDDVFCRLMTFPNVLLTSHQGFLTQEALSNIASTTLESIEDFQRKRPLENEILL